MPSLVGSEMCIKRQDHVSSNINKLRLLLCYRRVPFHQLASPPGFHVTHIPKGNLVIYFVHERDKGWVKLFHHQVMSDNIDDIQDARYHMTRRTFFLKFSCTWVCMGLGGSTCSKCFPVVTCDFEPQSTCHGPRRGPTLAPWCFGRLSACHGAENTRKDPRRKRKNADVPKKHIYA